MERPVSVKNKAKLGESSVLKVYYDKRGELSVTEDVGDV